MQKNIIKLLLGVTVTAVAVTVAVMTLRKATVEVIDSAATVETVTDRTIDITPTVIKSIEDIGEWAFLEIDNEEIVDTVRHGFFSDDRLVRIYYGTVRIGINLKETHEGWMAVENDTLKARLPKVRLLDDNFIDETRTKAFIETGKWSHQDRKALYDRAMAKMKRRCLTKENYKTAQDNAVEQFTAMLRAIGYDKVRVEVER